MLDVASEMGLEHHYEDFGQTMGRYGIGAGAYVVLPILGPVDGARRGRARRSIGYATPPAFFDGTGTQVGLTLLQVINTRSGLLGATRVIDDIALDKYTFIRDAYLQRRRSLVFDGNAPETPAAPEAGRVRAPPAPPRGTRGAAGVGACRPRGAGSPPAPRAPATLSDPRACSKGARIDARCRTSLNARIFSDDRQDKNLSPG